MTSPRLIAILTALTLYATAAHAADPLEGLWRVNGGGAVLEFAPEPGNSGRLTIAYIDGPDMSIIPGTVIGNAIPAGNPGKYDCRMSTDPRPDRRHGRNDNLAFTIEFSDENADAISLVYYRHKGRVSLARWIPYLFRVTYRPAPEGAGAPDGARREGAPPQFIVL